eukprot:362814-Chlamydomonas_euryale.AAC.11
MRQIAYSDSRYGVKPEAADAFGQHPKITQKAAAGLPAANSKKQLLSGYEFFSTGRAECIWRKRPGERNRERTLSRSLERPRALVVWAKSDRCCIPP